MFLRVIAAAILCIAMSGQVAAAQMPELEDISVSAVPTGSNSATISFVVPAGATSAQVLTMAPYGTIYTLSDLPAAGELATYTITTGVSPTGAPVTIFVYDGASVIAYGSDVVDFFTVYAPFVSQEQK